MSTGYIYNGFGGYDERNGIKGTALSYGGVEFFLPFQEVTAIPNWVFREVDHDKSTPHGDSKGELVYQNVTVNGGRIVEELLDKQIPIPNKQMGILSIKGKPTGKTLEVPAGCDADGNKVTAEIQEKEATKSEIEEATRLSKIYREEVVKDYFQSKREAMSGGKGRRKPDDRIRLYMEELDLQDIDDVSAHAKSPNGVTPELIAAIIEAVGRNQVVTKQALDEAVESVRKAGKAQLSPNTNGKRSLGLAEKKAQWDAAHPEEVLTK